MSRWLGTACRRFYHLSLFVDWDRHQRFHISMACLALFFATMHAIGHLTGTFVHGSRPENSEMVAELLHLEAAPSYMGFVWTVPGWTGILALILFWAMALGSMPFIRKRNYELFQASHLLMFPLIGLLTAHGTARLLQYPMLGFWLLLPTVLVLAERLHRAFRSYFFRTPASIKILDGETVTITCHERKGRPWRYTAGQYIFLQVPSISLDQWHPFTISHCAGHVLQMHIKTDGNWTRRLRSLPPIIEVGLDGPYGAPAQRFYEYDRSVIIGTGVGVTPFASIISDLELSIFDDDGWSRHRSRRMSRSRASSRTRSRAPSLEPHGRKFSPFASNTSSRTPAQAFISNHSSRTPSQVGSPFIGMSRMDNYHANDSSVELQTSFKPPSAKRVDFHWMVREKNSLLWFSDLLNRAHDLSRSLPAGSLDLNIHTHVTIGRSISEHIFCYLLDEYRSERCQTSALTGLKSRSHFGRPDFQAILKSFHEDVRQEVLQGVTKKNRKIAVFFCGAPGLGTMLSDLCYDLTLRGKRDGSGSRWDFKMEVFG